MNRPSPVAEPVKGQGHILLIDDEEAIVNLGRRSLEKLGYHVTGETRSRAALKRFAEDPTQYDLVITDQTMPDLTGIALAQELWKIRSDLLVIISTGFSETLTLEKASGVGFCALLNKPYTSSELAKTIRQCLCRSQKPESRSQNSEARIQNTRAGSL